MNRDLPVAIECRIISHINSIYCHAFFTLVKMHFQIAVIFVVNQIVFNLRRIDAGGESIFGSVEHGVDSSASFEIVLVPSPYEFANPSKNGNSKRYENKNNYFFLSLIQFKVLDRSEVFHKLGQ